MMELIEKRTERTKVFKLSKTAEVKRFFFQPVHFQENGEWQEIDRKLKKVRGKFKTNKTKYLIEAPVDGSKLGFSVGELTIDFIPVSTSIEIESTNTGIRKMVTLEKKPDNNEIDFEINIPDKADIWFNDINKQDKINKIRTKLSKLDKKRLILEKENQYTEARSIWDQQKQLEEDLHTVALSKWDKENDVTFQGEMKISLNEDVVYIRKPLVWDSNGHLSEISLKLSKNGNKLFFTKVLPQDFLDHATYPIKTDATTSYYIGSGDGYVTYYHASMGESWATVHNATSGTVAAESDTLIKANAGLFAGDYYIRRGFCPVDTSAITDTDVITNAVLFLDPYSHANGDSSSTIVVQTSQASTSTLVVDDYDNIDFTDGGSLPIASLSNETYAQIPLTFVGWVSKTGVTKIGLLNSRDQSDTTPTGLNEANFYVSETTGTSKDPYLDVTTITRTAKGFNNLMMGI